MLDGGEVVETLLDKETNNSVGVEDEVAAVGALVTDDAVKCNQRRSVSGLAEEEGSREGIRRGNAPQESDELGSLRENGDVGKVDSGRDSGGGLLLLGAVVGAHALGGRNLGGVRHVDFRCWGNGLWDDGLECRSRDNGNPANRFV